MAHVFEVVLANVMLKLTEALKLTDGIFLQAVLSLA